VVVGTWFAGILSALIMASGNGSLSYQWGLSTQRYLPDMQKRQQAYSELLGEKAVIAQYPFSRFEAYILKCCSKNVFEPLRAA
jgi:hypothetical protein